MVTRRWMLLPLWAAVCCMPTWLCAADFVVNPAKVELKEQFAQTQLVVTQSDAQAP